MLKQIIKLVGKKILGAEAKGLTKTALLKLASKKLSTTILESGLSKNELINLTTKGFNHYNNAKKALIAKDLKTLAQKKIVGLLKNSSKLTSKDLNTVGSIAKTLFSKNASANKIFNASLNLNNEYKSVASFTRGDRSYRSEVERLAHRPLTNAEWLKYKEVVNEAKQNGTFNEELYPSFLPSIQAIYHFNTTTLEDEIKEFEEVVKLPKEMWF